MVEAVSNPGILSVIRRFGAHTDLQGISADYYNLVDLQGAPLAGLLVLMDRRGRPVRAEIHMKDTATDTLYEMAVRQAHSLITARYRSDGSIRLYSLRVQLDTDPLSVHPEAPDRGARAPAWFFPVVGGALVVLFALISGWFLNEWLTGSPVRVFADSVNSDIGALTAASGNSGRIQETNGLPPSRHAIPMAVGDRAQLLPEYRIMIRTQAGAEAGEIVTYLQNANRMTIINGPIWLQGNSDTIVWWYVQLDDGTEGWAPANTSELILLQPLS